MDEFQSLLRHQPTETPNKGGDLGFLPVVAGLNLQSTQGLVSDSKGIVPAGSVMLKYSSAAPGKEGNAIQRALLKAHEQVKEKTSESSSGSTSSAPVSNSSGDSIGRGGSGDTGLASAVAALQGMGGLAPMDISAVVQVQQDYTPAPIAHVVAPTPESPQLG